MFLRNYNYTVIPDINNIPDYIINIFIIFIGIGIITLITIITIYGSSHKSTILLLFFLNILLLLCYQIILSIT